MAKEIKNLKQMAPLVNKTNMCSLHSYLNIRTLSNCALCFVVVQYTLHLLGVVQISESFGLVNVYIFNGAYDILYICSI